MKGRFAKWKLCFSSGKFKKLFCSLLGLVTTTAIGVAGHLVNSSSEPVQSKPEDSVIVRIRVEDVGKEKGDSIVVRVKTDSKNTDETFINIDDALDGWAMASKHIEIVRPVNLIKHRRVKR